MFIIKMFKQSFKFKTLLINFNFKFWQIIIYFILLMLIANFPQTFEAFRNYGTRLDFIIEDFNQAKPYDWQLPNNMYIRGGKLINNGDQNVYVYEHKGITYIINNQTKIDDTNDYLNHIIFSERSLIYIDNDGNILEAFDYVGFENDEFDFSMLNVAVGEELNELYLEFATSIERTFQNEIILFTVIRNNVVQIFINILYVLLLALFIQLFRFGYQKFLTYYESIKFVVLSLGLPAVLAFLIGLLSPAFAPVVFQLASGMTVMLVTLIFGKKLYS